MTDTYDAALDTQAEHAAHQLIAALTGHGAKQASTYCIGGTGGRWVQFYEPGNMSDRWHLLVPGPGNYDLRDWRNQHVP